MLTGTLVNGAAVIVCALLGTLAGSRIPQRICDTVIKGLGLCIIYIGISGALKGENTLIAIISVAVGAVIGESIDIDKYLNRFGRFVQSKIGGKQSTTADGFITATLLICVGAWAVTGAMDAGLRGDHSAFFAKAVVDGATIFIMATTLGIGTALSGIVLILYQGSLTLLSSVIEPLLTQSAVNELTCVGSLLIIAIGLNMLKITEIKVVNLLPAVFIPLILCRFI